MTRRGSDKERMTMNSTDTRNRRPARRIGGPIASLIALGALAALALPAGAGAAAQLQVSSTHYQDDIPVGAGAVYTVAISNVGDAPAAGPMSFEFSVPAGYSVDRVSAPTLFGGFVPSWVCGASDPQTATCNLTEGIGLEPGPGEETCAAFGVTCPIKVGVASQVGVVQAGDVLEPSIEVCENDGAACFNGADPTDIVPPKPFGVAEFDGGVFDPAGNTVTQAGAHPHSGSTSLSLDTIVTSILPDSQLQGGLHEISAEEWKDTFVSLPPGLIGNPRAVEACTVAQLSTNNCPPESQVGLVEIRFSSIYGGEPGAPTTNEEAVFNMQAPAGLPALFAFNTQGATIFQRPELRAGADYGIDIRTLNNPQTLALTGVGFTFWGVPADPSHDSERIGGALPPDTPVRPFLALPTSCVGPVDTDLRVTSWPGNEASASFTSHDNAGNPVGASGCAGLRFSPTLLARPTTNVADSPTGLQVDLQIPQGPGWEHPSARVTAHLRKAVVKLPPGMTVNPSGANGLGACSPSQIGLTSEPGAPGRPTYTPDEANCPASSRVADVVAQTPLLDHPVDGSVYVAKPYDNPFGALLALYLYLEDPESGTIVKLAGRVDPDPGTGQITSTFDNNPELPVSEISLDFFGGANAPLKTPAFCGQFETTSALTPYSAPQSGPPATPADAYQITQAPGGGPCPTSEGGLPNGPALDAGAVAPIAGHHSPFVVNLRRSDGTQRFSSVKLTPPPGLTAKLAGTPYCPDSALAAAAGKAGKDEEASPSCPAASRVGDVFAAAGAGPAPYWAPGTAYLTGPYKGAPLSLAIVTPAVAGPFDLGTVVIRTALHVNSRTAEITAVSDPLPELLQGIPLDIRTASVRLDKPDFALNGTSCDPMAVSGLLTSTLGAVAALSSRFQLAECTRLGFKPKMTLKLRGGTKRGKHPALTIALMPRAGDANIASVSVALPRSEFLENAHIRTVCTRPDFAADACPAGAIYGEATVDTPLLDYDLAGHVYLRSSDNLLPDVVPDLRGPAYQPIKLETAGRTDSIGGGIRTTIDFVPDAPFTKAVVALQGGNKGLLVNSRDICARTYRAKVRYTAHNGLTYVDHPKLRATGCKKRAKKGKRGAKRSAVALRGALR